MQSNKEYSLTQTITPADIYPIYGILFGRNPDFDPALFESSNEKILAFIQQCVDSQEFFGVIEQICHNEALPHFHSTIDINIDDLNMWLLAQFCEDDSDHIQCNNWWSIIKYFLDNSIVAGLLFPEGNLFSKARDIIYKKSLAQAAEIKYLEQEKVRNRLEKSLLFNDDAYLNINLDVANSGMRALDHYVGYGRNEGRILFNEKFAAALVGLINIDYQEEAQRFLVEYDAACEISRNTDRPSKNLKSISVFFHSKGNYFMKPIADATAKALTAAGRCVRVLNETTNDLNYNDVNIVVAPHEFFGLDLPYKFKTSSFFDSCIPFNTEQVPSKYFSAAMRDILQCNAMIDINYQTHKIIQQFMPACYFLPPFEEGTMEHSRGLADLMHPLFRSIDDKSVVGCNPETNLSSRPIDIMFAGFSNKYRNGFFVRNAEYLSSKNCFLAYKREGGGPANAGMWNDTIFNTNNVVSCASKIVLAIHRYPIGYVEWERMIVQGFASGSCVLATTGIESPFFKPGIHYLEAPLRHFGPYLKYLLDDKEGIDLAQKIARQGKNRLSSVLTEYKSGCHLSNFIQQVMG